MNNFYFIQPVPIDFGIGKLQTLPSVIEKIKGQRGLLISTPSIVKNGIAQKLVDLSGGKLQAIFSDIQPNPTVENTDNCVTLLRELNCDFAVAIGGGSVMDCAKIACFVAGTDGTTSEYFHQEKAISHKGIPLITIPTTSGSASEVSSVSVLTDTARNIKAPIASPYLYADYALVDPELTVSCPPSVTAVSGIDVLAHALEAFYGVRHQPYTDLLAEHAARLVFESLATAYKEPTNIEARSKMAEASVAAGLAFSLTGTAAAHACSYPLTQIFGVPHGEACAMTLAAYWRLNAQVDDRLHAFSKRLGFHDAIELADAIDQLKRTLGLRFTLQDAHVDTEEKLDLLVAESFAPNMKNNPVDITPELLKELYKAL